MESGLILLIYSTHLSGGELLELQRIAAKSKYSQKEVKFALALASRTLKKVRNSLSVDQVTIRPEGMNFLITSK